MKLLVIQNPSRRAKRVNVTTEELGKVKLTLAPAERIHVFHAGKIVLGYKGRINLDRR